MTAKLLFITAVVFAILAVFIGGIVVVIIIVGRCAVTLLSFLAILLGNKIYMNSLISCCEMLEICCRKGVPMQLAPITCYLCNNTIPNSVHFD